MNSRAHTHPRRNRGFTLVEIAIVLVIIGLLLGGILKGQELINNARVRAIADRSNSLKAAWYAFIDRYQALPGDFVQAVQYVPGAQANGKGIGTLEFGDSPLVMNHLTGAGLLRCAVCTDSATAGKDPTAANSLVNLYGGIISIWHNKTNYMVVGGHNAVPRLTQHTGPRIPSNIITEVDRKVDDGLPMTGDFVFVNYDPSLAGGVGGIIKTELCVHANGLDKNSGLGDIEGADSSSIWRHAQASPPVTQNCGAGSFF